MDKTAATIDEYIAQYSPDIQSILKEIYSTIQKAAPQATEKISWGMATFVLNGNLVHFSAQKKHVGFHPAPSAIMAFRDELAQYQCSKGTVQFPYEKSLPLDLIGKMVHFRVEEQLALVHTKQAKAKTNMEKNYKKD